MIDSVHESDGDQQANLDRLTQQEYAFIAQDYARLRQLVIGYESGWIMRTIRAIKQRLGLPGNMLERDRFAAVPFISQQAPSSVAPEKLAWLHLVPDSSTSVAPPVRLPLRSESCAQFHFYLDLYRYWVRQIGEEPRFHRKQWEFVYIAQALWERDLLREAKKGLGFGVGLEPLTALFASLGCKILATDLDEAEAAGAGWIKTDQHAHSLDMLNDRNICPPDLFRSRVSFRAVDMNAIPAELDGFDFCWSACCLEHLGTLQAGMDFVVNSLHTLKVGGWAVHTTELNMSSGRHTIVEGSTVLYRQRDLQDLCDEIEGRGHYVEPLLIHRGSGIIDDYVDVPPYRDDPHLRLQISNYVTTSVGLIVQRRH